MRTPFGQALTNARIAAGLSQDELGELMEVRQSSVCQWESGAINPIASHYRQLLDLFPVLRFVPRPQTRDQEKPGPAPAPRSARKPRMRSRPARLAGQGQENTRVHPIREAV